MKSTMILLSCFIFAAAFAYGQATQSDQAGDQQSQTSTSEQSTTSSDTPSTDAPKLTATKSGKAVGSFHGTGSQTTKPFSLAAGKATFEIVLAWEQNDATLNKEEGNFSVVLLDEAGKNPDLIIGTIDHFDGARTIDIPKAGKYTLKITAPGKWTVDVKQ